VSRFVDLLKRGQTKSDSWCGIQKRRHWLLLCFVMAVGCTDRNPGLAHEALTYSGGADPQDDASFDKLLKQLCAEWDEWWEQHNLGLVER
jgi:hypothetical protein